LGLELDIKVENLEYKRRKKSPFQGREYDVELNIILSVMR
jgi:hypothetical protein